MVLVSAVHLDGTVVLKDVELEPGQEIQSLRTQVSDVLKSKLIVFSHAIVSHRCLDFDDSTSHVVRSRQGRACIQEQHAWPE